MDLDTYRSTLADLQGGTELAFPPEEFSERRRRVRAAMDQAGLDVLLLTDPAELFYLVGYNTFEVSVPVALVLGPDKTVLQVPSIETGPAVVTASVDSVIGYRWEDPQGIIQPLCDLLSPYKRVGVDLGSGSLRPAIWQALTQAVGAERFTDRGDIVDRVRLVKSPAELGYLEESARLTEIGMAAGLARVEPGVTDSQVAAAASEALTAAGSEFMSMQPIVTTGRRSGVIHLNHQRHVIEPGQSVFLEMGASFNRYTAPMMKTRVAGEPDGDMTAVADLCHDLYETLLSAMVPGQTFDAAARSAEARLNSANRPLFFSGVYGYAVGAQFPPSWVEGTGYIARDQMRVFEPGMVFHLPLCLRWPGHWGIGLSNTVVVTETGPRSLTHNDWQLTESERDK